MKKYGTMTGSGSKSNLMVVPSAPSKVTNTPSLSVVWTIFETPAEMDLTSRWTFPLAPSAQISKRWMCLRSFSVGQTVGSSSQVFSGSPVAGSQRSLKVLKGMRISEKSSPAGTSNLALKQFPEKGSQSLAQKWKGTQVFPTNEIRKPLYSGEVVRTLRIKSPETNWETSLKCPPAVALIKPGACRDGTSETVPLMIPNPPSESTDHEPVETPPWIIIHTDLT